MGGCAPVARAASCRQAAPPDSASRHVVRGGKDGVQRDAIRTGRSPPACAIIRARWSVRNRPNMSSRSLASLATMIHASKRSEEHTSELQSLMRISYAVFCLNKKTQKTKKEHSQ